MDSNHPKPLPFDRSFLTSGRSHTPFVEIDSVPATTNGQKGYKGRFEIKPSTSQMNARKLFIAVCLAILNAITVQSQTTGTSCDSDALNDSLLTHDPVFHRNFQYMEQMLAIQRGLNPAERTDDIYTLPVVVHVIHNGEPYGVGVNITDEQIYSAIEALNEDYRHLPGTNGYGDGPDIGIEFCMAARNPSGQPTTGIVRVNGSAVTNYSTMGIEASGGNGAIEENVKALSTWPRASYLNIWVVNEIENNDGGSGIQGYAYFPINNPIDGIVVLFNAFGTTGNLKSYTNMNRTLTHEVGHYLGLYHTFNGTSSCTAESDCNTQGDRVCDTPVTIQSSSCSSPACSGTQQVENYMDYTSQTCQDMFSEGQKLRMRTTLETQRTSMITSMGCMPVFTNDVGITAVLSPTGTNCQGALNPQVTLSNFGSSTLTSVNIIYNVDGTSNATFNWTGTLASGASATVTLGAINPTGGAHTFYAWSNLPNGTADQNTSNDQSTGTFSISSGSPLTLDVVLDYYGNETTWAINDENDFVMMTGGPYVNGQQGLHNLTPVCLAPGCYTLIMTDAYGDGQGFTNGSFSLTTSSGTVLASGSGNWGDTSANDFCVTGTTPTGNAPVASFTMQDNTVCKNVQNDFTSTSTESPTSYSWIFEGGTPGTSTSQNPQNITYATSGTYDVTLTATNANGSNTYTCSNCITVYADPVVVLTATNPLCATGATGAVVSSVTGTSPYSYSWSNGATSGNINNVAAGTYTLTVTDGNGCTKQSSTSVVAPSAIAITGTANNTTCATMNNGSIAVNATGGTGSKTYLWSNGASGALVSNLSPGNYSVTATDANLCTASQSYTVTAPAAMVVSGTTTNPTCAGPNTGSISVSVTGGTGSKTYSWNTGATGSSINGIAAGSYTVTVTDANGCVASQTFTLSTPAGIVITGTAVNPTCNNNSNGSISVSATGGTGNKTFTWSNGATGAVASNLNAGSYTVTATDQAGCTQTQSYTLTSPSPITATANITQVSCSGFSDGSIALTSSGGTGSKTYSWSNGSTTSTIADLTSGNYTVVITDANACTVSQNYTVTAPAPIAINLNTYNIACGEVTGSATVNPTGGTTPYSTTWSNGSTGNSAAALAAGSYTVTVIDGNGCNANSNFSISQGTGLTVIANAANVTCHGEGDGAVTITVVGGDLNYTYTWSNGAITSGISGLSAGSYTVTVEDGNGCSGSASATVVEPSSIALSVNPIGALCAGQATGSASVSSTGGTGSINYLWSNGTTGASASGLNAGTYDVTATDAAGCTANANFTITAPSAISASAVFNHVTCFGGNNGSIALTSTGGNGNKTYSWSNGANTSTITGLVAGNYSVVITDENNCSVSQNYSITQPNEIILSLITNNISCTEITGDALVNPTGGSGVYTISWSNGSSGFTSGDLSAGNYSVNVADNLGCTISENFTISQTAGLTVNAIATNINCFGYDNGSIALTVSGGNGSNTYVWSNGASSANLNGLQAGTYSVTVTDGNGCSGNASATITEPSSIALTLDLVQPLCANQAGGSASVIATGGTGNKSFVWSNGAAGPSVSGLSAGAYSVTATDANGCSATMPFTVVAPAVITATATVTHISCSGENDGSISVDANGGTGEKSFNWSNGSNASAISSLSAGNYSVIISDENECVISQNYVITTPSVLTANLIDFDIACTDEFGSAQVSPSGGTSPYTVNWSNGASSNNAGNLPAGNYSVSVTDAHGCASSTSFEITQNSGLTVYAEATNIACNGDNNGSIETIVNGGDQNYTYLWSNGSSGTNLSNLAAGNYSVTVTDGNGCSGSASASISEPSALYLEMDDDDVSCYGLNDGIGLVMASGGTSPYQYQWSNGASGESVNDLAPGQHTVTVTDYNGCVVQGMVNISEPNMLVANVIVLASETCAGNNGSAEVMVEGGTPGYLIVWSNGSSENVLSGAASGNYSVIVSDEHGCLINLAVEIPYDCEAGVPATQLGSADCNAVNVGLNSIIHCDVVVGAAMYQWRFMTNTGVILADEYSLGNSFYVSQLPALGWNTTYLVGVKALVDSNWGPFGQFCSITTEPVDTDQTTGLIANDCGSTVLTWGQVLTATEIPAVMNYQWHITGFGYDWLTYTTDNVLEIDEAMELIPGETYSVQMRCAFGDGMFTEWGPTCTFTLAMTIGLDEQNAIPGFIAIYPNPCDGESITFDFTQLRSEMEIKNVTLYNSSGGLVEKLNITSASGANKQVRHQFNNKLASGLYVLSYELNGYLREFKLLVK